MKKVKLMKGDIKMKEWEIKGMFDLYNLNTNEILVQDIFRQQKIYKGQEIITDDIYDDKKYVIIDYIEFCDRNNQIVYACLEDLREQKLNQLGI